MGGVQTTCKTTKVVASSPTSRSSPGSSSHFAAPLSATCATKMTWPRSRSMKLFHSQTWRRSQHRREQNQSCREQVQEAGGIPSKEVRTLHENQGQEDQN